MELNVCVSVCVKDLLRLTNPPVFHNASLLVENRLAGQVTGGVASLHSSAPSFLPNGSGEDRQTSHAVSRAAYF